MNWHEEYYKNALREIKKALNPNTEFSLYTCQGWTEWLEEYSPQKYKLLELAIDESRTFNSIKWDYAKERFKKGVQAEIEITIWAVKEYLKWQAEKAIKIELKTCGLFK